jgi:hypothetical protein
MIVLNNTFLIAVRPSSSFHRPYISFYIHSANIPIRADLEFAQAANNKIVSNLITFTDYQSVQNSTKCYFGYSVLSIEQTEMY